MYVITSNCGLVYRTLDHITNYNMFMIQSVATYSALIWLLFRAWQTLWKPVPELINILGVDVPDPPEVCLAGIKSDSVTLHWSKPDPLKPVIKYFIQVNGLNVGETSRLETAITVTGLRPVHYYNIRIISVGSNNFQAGSLVIRLQTYGKNGRPILDNNEEHSELNFQGTDSNSGDNTYHNSHGVCVEATALPECLSNSHREITTSVSGVKNSSQRRNAGGATSARKHSHSTTSAETTPSSMRAILESKETAQKLTEELDSINREREKIAAETVKEAEDFKILFAELCNDRDEKKNMLKEREEASEKLKKEVYHAERLNRHAQTRKSQKEKLLKEKIAERSKIREDIKRWRKEIEDMKVERGHWRGEREKAEKNDQIKVADLNEEIKRCQATLNSFEEEIRVKGSQINQLEKNGKSLPGNKNDEETRLRDEQEDLEWDITEKTLTAELNSKSQQLRDIGTNLHLQQAYLSNLQHRSSMICQEYYSSMDYDSTGPQAIANPRSNRNRHSPAISPILNLSTMGSSFISSGNLNCKSPAFAPGPYIDLSNNSALALQPEHSDETTDEDYGVLTHEAPLSQTATSLLPSNIFADDDPPSLQSGSIESSTTALLAPETSHRKYESNLPSPSGHSVGLLSNTLKPSRNLTIQITQSHNHAENDNFFVSSRQSPSSAGLSITPKNMNHKGFRDIFSPKPKTKDIDQDGKISVPLSGNQANRYSLILDEGTSVGEDLNRRTSYPSGWSGLLHRTSISRKPLVDSIAPIAMRNPSVMRTALDLQGSNLDDPELQNSHHSSPSRSAVSSDLPRPSTDSAPFGWGPVQDNPTNRKNPLSTDWSIHSPKNTSLQRQNTWSSYLSKGANFRKRLDTAFLSRLANDDDEFLPPSEALTSQSGQTSSIGAIGTRQSPTYQTLSTPKLNPAAPAFQGFNIRANSKSGGGRCIRNDLSKKNTSASGTNTVIDKTNLSIPTAARKSSDLLSTRSQNKITEYYNSLGNQNRETLPGKALSLSGKGKEDSSLQGLFRKGNSSKFNISSFRNKDAGFNRKITNAEYFDRESSFERENNIERDNNKSSGKSRNGIDHGTTSSENALDGCTQSVDKDLNSKDGRLGMNRGRLGIRGKKGKEDEDVFDRSKDSIMKNSET
ncbi:putative fibronectin type iii domain-containing protein [Golovinomyces cichoracearum]|uniref:Putative fibronectin type iii domain-containing protein n=1 Tax=Golovinomyces cichoracearum TaxID=62708 RepID=A0A420JB94_9PEZI|nr:putative fibronectin type iii domain-containing protein [Golovinomyces cichoracearum]